MYSRPYPKYIISGSNNITLMTSQHLKPLNILNYYSEIKGSTALIIVNICSHIFLVVCH